MADTPDPTRDAPPSAQEAVRKEYARLAAGYDRRWAGYVTASVRETLRRLDLRSGERLLDVGCGTGVLLDAVRRAAPGVRIVGVDLSPEMLSVAAHRLGLATRLPAAPPQAAPLLAAADAARLPFAPGIFDAVVSSSSFHYWRRPEVGLAEVARVLRLGGRLVITDWCDDFLACRICDLVLRLVDPAHRRAYGSRECAAFLARAGYTTPVVERYKLNWLWGLMTATAVRRHPALLSAGVSAPPFPPACDERLA